MQKPRVAKRKLYRPFDAEPIHPQHIYRWIEGPRFFGFGLTVLGEKIAAGEIPAPLPLSDGGHAKGWLGQQILDWQQERLSKAQNAARSCLHETAASTKRASVTN
jgi:predicted DNA-binding transcriptional regulator AlpA